MPHGCPHDCAEWESVVHITLQLDMHISVLLKIYCMQQIKENNLLLSSRVVNGFFQKHPKTYPAYENMRSMIRFTI